MASWIQEFWRDRVKPQTGFGALYITTNQSLARPKEEVEALKGIATEVIFVAQNSY